MGLCLYGLRVRMCSALAALSIRVGAQQVKCKTCVYGCFAAPIRISVFSFLPSVFPVVDILGSPHPSAALRPATKRPPGKQAIANIGYEGTTMYKPSNRTGYCAT